MFKVILLNGGRISQTLMLCMLADTYYSLHSVIVLEDYSNNIAGYEVIKLHASMSYKNKKTVLESHNLLECVFAMQSGCTKENSIHNAFCNLI